MIQKGIINEEVSYMIIANDEISKYSLHITNATRECKLMKIRTVPTDREYKDMDLCYVDFVKTMISNGEIAFGKESLFIIICGIMEKTDTETPLEDKIPSTEMDEFVPIKPKMHGDRNRWIIHPSIKRPKRTFLQILFRSIVR